MAADVIVFRADRQAYVRSHTWMAAAAMAGAMLILWIAGSDHVWTGAPAGLAAVALRGWYLASEELAATWEMNDRTLEGPGGRSVPLDQIASLRVMGGFVQIVTQQGDKHLIKFQADPEATRAAIQRAIG